jgi:hypothetical protein
MFALPRIIEQTSYDRLLEKAESFTLGTLFFKEIGSDKSEYSTF